MFAARMPNRATPRSTSSSSMRSPGATGAIRPAGAGVVIGTSCARGPGTPYFPSYLKESFTLAR
jgi:hypothetical protein